MRSWREDQILKGRDPDSYIESQLVKEGKWPTKKEGNPDK